MNVLVVQNLIRNYKMYVGKSKEEIEVLKGVSFEVAQREFVGIMGKSGSGKTTLLKVLGMIDKQTGGTIEFMGEDTSNMKKDELADIRRKKDRVCFSGFLFNG